MQSFCHTAAYPKPVDVVTHHTLPDFIRNRGGRGLHSSTSQLILCRSCHWVHNVYLKKCLRSVEQWTSVSLCVAA